MAYTATEIVGGTVGFLFVAAWPFVMCTFISWGTTGDPWFWYKWFKGDV